MVHQFEPEREPSVTDELLADEHFQEWVLHGGEELDAYWEAWQVQQPEKVAALKAAKEVLLAIRFVEHPPVPARKAAARGAYLSALTAAGLKEQKMRVVHRFRRIAAAASVLIALGAGWYAWKQLQPKEYVTAYGEIRRLTLPDQTEVVLHANSRLLVAGDWKYGNNRKVRLEGEAYFNVPAITQTTNPAPPFTVQVNNASVTVLGTAFNVRLRRNALAVVLVEGKVRVDIPGGGKGQVLQPGELLRYEEKNGQIKVSPADTTAAMAWTKGQLVLHRTSAGEVLQSLEDIYGYKVRTADSALLQKELEGELLTGNPEEIIFLLSQLLDADITVSGKMIDLKKR